MSFRRRGPRFVLAVYAACLLVICAFVVFDVLDLDGSDFPRQRRAVWSQSNSPEPPRDLKRAQPHGFVHAILEAPPRPPERAHAASRARSTPMPIASPLGGGGGRYARTTLPRASLPAPSSAA